MSTFGHRADNIDPAAKEHLTKILTQSLQSLRLDHNNVRIWRPVLLKLAQEFAKDIPTIIATETASRDPVQSGSALSHGVSPSVPVLLSPVEKPLQLAAGRYGPVLSNPSDSAYYSRQQLLSGHLRLNLPFRPDACDGIIILCGADRAKLELVEQLVSLTIYVVFSMKLEEALRADHHIPRPKPSNAGVSQRQESVSGTLDAAQNEIRKPAATPQSPFDSLQSGSKIWSWMKKKLSDRPPPVPPKGEPLETSHGDETGPARERSLGKRRSTLDISSFARVAPNPLLPTELQDAIAARERLVVSTTPDVNISLPYILRRLQNEYQAASVAPPEKSQPYSQIYTVGRSQTLPTSATVDLPKLAIESTMALSKLIPEDVSKNHLTGSIRNPPADASRGSNLPSIVQHQSISFSTWRTWSETLATPCYPPSIVTFEFFQNAGGSYDVRLGEFVEQATQQAFGKCDAPSCDKPKWKHITTFTHDQSRITIQCELVTSWQQIPVSGEPPYLEDTIYIWSTCTVCQKSTKPSIMSAACWNYSLGKFLELLCYNPRFIPADLCACNIASAADKATGPSPSNCHFHYRRNNVIVTFELEHIGLFELRPPCLHALSSVDTQPQILKDRLIDEKTKSRLVDGVSNEIADLHESLGKSLSKVGSSLRALRKGVAKDTLDSVQNQLELLSEKYQMLDSVLFALLSKTNTEQINNVRIALRRKIDEIQTDLADFGTELTAMLALKSPPTWEIKSPEYANPASNITLPPDSFVLIYENEPTSLLAYTLSSTLYLMEVDKIRLRTRSEELLGTASTNSDPTIFSKSGESPKFFENPAVFLRRIGSPTLPTNGVASPASPTFTASIPKRTKSSMVSPFTSEVKTFAHVSSNGIAQPNAPQTEEHITLKWSENSVQFSCTVYYAERFDTLRRKYNIHESYIHSLMRCSSWNANGGKSKATFFKTHDDRLVVKQLTSNWTRTEKDDLLSFATNYIDYMIGGDKRVSLIAKIFGFYTIKRKNLQTKEIMEIDVLIMENVFYQFKISRKFDLKGVQVRHNLKEVKENRKDQVLWDGDWVDGRCKDQFMLYAYSKLIITEAIQNDVAFLSNNNIMDYSLLLGVDNEKKELVGGIVDIIGTYTWYKKLESRGKLALANDKESVTVLPPVEYARRFRESIESYFLMVPDKWTDIGHSGPSSLPQNGQLPRETGSQETGSQETKITRLQTL